ncbi:hypothetical protein BJV38_004197 [Clostridium beijerinckii]|uniref:hypothetical protein n=1 Tax=Clostridium beijerinckii TaxID=1520 RepID=UPI00157153C4|nr:hypothetical protein [Clostridium beijerinckii]NRT33220.1 hypothetical protein [Clostridium beijerinckii]NRT47354.1 hypothetical protein [Clostridium beijerinckii]NRZ18641.1 hypothetical protein [Clostridium beijerinckii]
MKELSISIPSTVTNIPSTYVFITSLYNKFKNESNCKIAINCENMKYIDPTMMAPLGLVLTRFKTKKNLVYFKKLTQYNIRYLIQSNFLKPTREESISITENFINYNSFNSDDYPSFKNYLTEQLGIIGDDDIINLLVTCLSELFENVNMHARINSIKYHDKEVFSSGYYNEKDNFVIFSLSNNGLSFKEKISSRLDLHFSNEYEYVLWALKARNSTRKKTTPGGIGLTVLLDLIKNSNGLLTIVSGKGYINFDYDKNIYHKNDISNKFPGTIITFKIPLLHMKSYLQNLYHNYEIQDCISAFDLLNHDLFNKNHINIMDILKENLLKEAL